MPTLRERPSRGLDVSPAKKASPTSARSSRGGQTTPRSQRKLSGAAANMAGDAIEVRESIEAKGDVEMSDAQDTVAARRYKDDADADADGDIDADGDVDMDAEGEPDDDVDQAQNQESIDLLQLIKQTTEYLCDYTVNEGEEDEYLVAEPFQRLVNKRSLPDYFEVIKEPIAFSTIRGKTGKKTYETFAQFVGDVTRICWNAMYYNRPSSQIFKDAGLLLEIFKKKLAELVEKGAITEKDAILPDYGPLPEVEDSPPVEEEGDEEEEDEDEEEEEDDEDDDDSDDEGRKKRRNRSARQSARRDGGDVDHSKRGRPPKVYTPLEARIEAILKGLRRYKNADGHLGITAFEKLPDKTVLPEYYAAIASPISLEMIKKNHKRKKYKTVDQMVQDLDLMFENAKTFNEEDSVIHQDAIQLQKDAHQLAEEQKARPDDEFRDSDGRLPLSHVVHKDETWKVGDWVHLRNPNDLGKPIVGQIYRLWSDMSGEKKLNACWYYRPEQTVHRFDKWFWKNEVVKTGRYRDHNVSEIEDRCFVMYITRYHRGRPRGFPKDKAVYVCESRYNEDNHRFNKIKTWSSCLPDEVRDKDYEMDLFEPPLPLQKEPSKIKHLLHPNARETDELPVPTWGAPNAPPLIGAVHRRPREANESPPPDERPRAAPIPPQAALAMGPSARPVPPGMAAPFHVGVPAGAQPFQQFQVARQAPPPVPHGQAGVGVGQVHIQPQPHAVPGMHVQQHPAQHPSMAHMQPQQQQHQQPMQLQPLPPQGGPAQQHFPAHPYQPPFAAQPQAPQQLHYQNAAHLAPAAAYDHHHRQMQPGLTPGMTPPRHHATMAPSPNAPPMQPHPASANMANGQYNIPRPMEAYTLPDNLDSSIPPEVREQFQRDDTGRVLFFTAPPLNRPANGVAPEQAGLGHSVSHLASIHKVREERRKQKAARDAELKEQANKKLRANKENITSMKNHLEQQELARKSQEWLDNWVKEMNEGTAWILEQTGAAYFPTKEEKQRKLNMTENERQVNIRSWFAEYRFRKGLMTAEELEKELAEIHATFGPACPPLDENKQGNNSAEDQEGKATQT